MKHSLMLALTGAVVVSLDTIAAAQTARTRPRTDVTLTMGWLNGHEPSAEPGSNDWYNRGLYGSGGLGWYWSDHHKTELDIGISNSADLYRYRNVVVDAVQTYQNSELTFRTKRLALGEQYQFFRNAWFHPHVTAGADFIWETNTEHAAAITTYDQQARQVRELRPARVIGPETTLLVRPFGEVGFKAYMTPRAFFRSDVRLGFRRGVEDVLVRFGFGVDF